MYTNCEKLRSNPETCNAGKKWDTDEDELLIKLFNENKSYEEIAKEFKRTVGSIRARIIDKIIFPEYNNDNFNELAEKYKFDDVLYLERIIKAQIAKKERSKENSIITKKLFENETKEDYDIRMQEIKEKKLNKKIEKKEIKAAGGQKYYELLLNIVERLERIEKKIDGYDFT
jgi:Mor family transcriptional regulator